MKIKYEAIDIFSGCGGVSLSLIHIWPGAKGIGDTAIRNYDKWKEIRVQMDTLVENRPCDTTLELFGRTFQYPFFAGPVGAVQLHYGDCLNDISYNDILVSACAASGIAAFTGDGTDSNVMVAATKAIKNAGGLGIPTVKPWNIEVIREKMAMVKDSGAFAVAMDIDAAGLPFLKNLTPPAGSKSVEDLREVKQAAGLPFIVKGIMTVKGAMKAKEAGADAIVVSNHGGRVLDLSLIHIFREYFEEKEAVVSVILDTSASMHYGKKSKAELAQDLCAVIAFLTLHHMDRLVLYDSSQMGTPLVVSGGKNALPKVLGWLQARTFSGTETDSFSAVRQMQRLSLIHI